MQQGTVSGNFLLGIPYRKPSFSSSLSVFCPIAKLIQITKVQCTIGLFENWINMMSSPCVVTHQYEQRILLCFYTTGCMNK